MITIRKNMCDMYEVKDLERNEVVLQDDEKKALDTAHLRLWHVKQGKESRIKIPIIGLWLVW